MAITVDVLFPIKMTIELGDIPSPTRESSRPKGEEILWLRCVSASALRRILEVNRYVFAHIL